MELVLGTNHGFFLAMMFGHPKNHAPYVLESQSI
jgi:hypothetical protein